MMRMVPRWAIAAGVWWALCAGAAALSVGCGGTSKPPAFTDGGMTADAQAGTVDAELDGALGGCDSSDACPAATPICDARVCRACSADLDCTSRTDGAEIGLCAGDGHCVGPGEVWFVKGSSLCAAATGESSAPFCTIQEAVNRSIATPGRVGIAVRAGNYDGFTVQDQTLAIVAAPDTHVNGGGSAKTRITITGAAAHVLVRGFTVSVASAATGVVCSGGAHCDLEQLDVGFNGTGVSASSAGELVLRRSRIHDNSGGGVVTSASSFLLENDLIHDNGNASSPIGGVSLGTGAERIFRFNTVFRNHIATGSAAGSGVQCGDTTILASSVFWKNDAPAVHAGKCSGSHAMLQSVDPLFMSEASSPDLHLTSGSPCVDGGDTTGAPALDYFGQPRTGTPDIGADELGTP